MANVLTKRKYKLVLFTIIITSIFTHSFAHCCVNAPPASCTYLLDVVIDYTLAWPIAIWSKWRPFFGNCFEIRELVYSGLKDGVIDGQAKTSWYANVSLECIFLFLYVNMFMEVGVIINSRRNLIMSETVVGLRRGSAFKFACVWT